MSRSTYEMTLSGVLFVSALRNCLEALVFIFYFSVSSFVLFVIPRLALYAVLFVIGRICLHRFHLPCCNCSRQLGLIDNSARFVPFRVRLVFDKQRPGPILVQFTNIDTSWNIGGHGAILIMFHGSLQESQIIRPRFQACVDA